MDRAVWKRGIDKRKGCTLLSGSVVYLNDYLGPLWRTVVSRGMDAIGPRGLTALDMTLDKFTAKPCTLAPRRLSRTTGRRVAQMRHPPPLTIYLSIYLYLCAPMAVSRKTEDRHSRWLMTSARSDPLSPAAFAVRKFNPGCSITPSDQRH